METVMEGDIAGAWASTLEAVMVAPFLSEHATPQSRQKVGVGEAGPILTDRLEVCYALMLSQAFVSNHVSP